MPKSSLKRSVCSYEYSNCSQCGPIIRIGAPLRPRRCRSGGPDVATENTADEWHRCHVGRRRADDINIRLSASASTLNLIERTASATHRPWAEPPSAAQIFFSLKMLPYSE